ncbi:hypothetical protein [Streptomyces sp. NPDC001985]|uniref:hypothetical protein n=1 Tax=Streptomyces sp. NPDC001985 TaxID=3154406 RepID=UPI00332B9185
MDPRPRPPWAAGCLTFLAGGLAGYGAHRLSRAARRTCRLILREHPSIFDWWTWQAPLTIIAASFIGLTAWAIPAALLRRAPRWARRIVPGAVFTLALAALVLWHFAWLGTPLRAGTDGGACAADHVPPWWPAWLPE